MLSKTKVFIITLIFFILNINSQINRNRKTSRIKRVSIAPKIDGELNDQAWKNLSSLKNFVMLEPNNGENENGEYKSEIKLCYDDDAIYISAILYNPQQKTIAKEFSKRDNFGNSDFLGINISPNDDGINSFFFFVQSTGNQLDAKVSSNNRDFNWNAVWLSEVKAFKNGWKVEVKIPYRALRFSNKEKQSWGLNIHRNIRNLNAEYTWNHIDNSKGVSNQYNGLITGINNIKPPTRLIFYPYASTISVFNKKEKSIVDQNYGMDIKYGISDNFTLDASLIPDFSQVGFDDITLNLGPFEQQFSEQRAFFTEGTELFNKGGLFYSRRIGSTPIGINDITLKENETITNNPEKTQLLNAIKISGRTKKGLAIGFFNAITDRSRANIFNKESQKSRKVVTQSLTNYNVAVIDKQFNGNSSISLTNTNVFREGKFNDANASALAYHIETKDSKYFIDGGIKISHINNKNPKDNTGYAFDTSLGKGFGNWRGEIGYRFEDKNFNPNDLGFLGSNNEGTIYGNTSYRILKPKGIFNNFGVNFWGNINFINHKTEYTHSFFGLNAWFDTKNRFSFGSNLRYRTLQKDYFEAQRASTDGIFFIRNSNIYFNHWASTDYRKKTAIDYNFNVSKRIGNSRLAYGFNIRPRYRFSNKTSIIYQLRHSKAENDRGFVTNANDQIIFGIRDRNSYTNSISTVYNFNTKSSLSLSLRHYWSKVIYTNYKKLDLNGTLTSTLYNQDNNINFNNWNLDINYQWQLAPGSFLTAFYRNTINDTNNNTDFNFTTNIENIFNQSMKHTFSLKLIYFIDYNEINSFFKK